MRYAELLALGSARLKEAGIEEYESDARLLLQYSSNQTRTELFLNGADRVPPELVSRFERLLEKRRQRCPLAYITGEREFWSLPFIVTPDVLIPRPETEFLLDRVFALTKEENWQRGKLLDLCCGSGVIAVVLARERRKRLLAIDRSQPALAVSRLNAVRHGVEGLIDLVQTDVFLGIRPLRQFSLIVCNPPYINEDEIACGLAPEVAEHEPQLALSGGPDGLRCIRRILVELTSYLCPGGQFFMEMGAEQARAVLAQVSALDDGGRKIASACVFKDYAGRDRVLALQLSN